MKILGRCAGYFRSHAGSTVFALALLVAATLLQTLRPWPLAILIDRVLGGAPGPHPVAPEIASIFGRMPPLWAAAALAAGVVGLQSLAAGLTFWHTWIFVRVGLRALLEVRARLYAALQGLSLGFFEERRSGDATFRVTYDTQSIQTLYNRGFATVAGAVLSLGMMFAVMWRVSPPLTLVSLAAVPPLSLAIVWFAARIRRQTEEVHREESDVLSQAQEGLSSVRIIQAFGRERHEVARFRRECEDSLAANLRLTFTSVGSSFVVGLIMAAGTAALFFVGARQVVEGTLTIGFFVMFLDYLAMLYRPLEQLCYTGWAVSGATAGMRRVFEIMDARDDVADRPGALPLGPVRGEIEFRGVAFGYRPGQVVLDGLDLKVEAGRTAAIVGPSGSGKSTLLALVPRFYDVGAGSVSIDGVDVRQTTKESLRARVAMVLEDTLLLSTTIRENIAYGRLEAGDAEIVAAACAAGAEEFIARLPRGYDTKVGERGATLSAGQRQRIGIARAFLKDAPILLMDEPTSALDGPTESRIVESLRRLMQGRTVLIVTHRLAAIQNADRIHTLAGGRIVESGTGPELLAAGGAFAQFWQEHRANRAV